jgi:hypothetical protein
MSGAGCGGGGVACAAPRLIEDPAARTEIKSARACEYIYQS